MGETVGFETLGQHPSAGAVPSLNAPRYATDWPLPHYDALVFGNGPAACVFAIQMLRLGKTVLLVGRGKSIPKPWGETLAPRGEFVLARLGLANECLAGHYATRTMLSCWLTPRPEATDFSFDPHGRMWHLNRPAFDRALLNHAATCGADVLEGEIYRVAGISKRAQHWEVRVAYPDREHTIKTAYIVDATGRSHGIARRMGARRILRDRVVAAFYVCEQGGDPLPLLIEPTSRGWWYSLGLPDGKLLVALMTDTNFAKAGPQTRNSVWDSTLSEAPYTKGRIGTRVSGLSFSGAESARLDRMSGEGWLAIGDAAMSFDPLSSHGLCSAMEQAMDAAELLSTCSDKSSLAEFDSKRSDLFARYTAQRKAFYKRVERFSAYPFWQTRILQ